MRTEKGLFDALEAVLKRSKEPQTCVQLFERPEIQEHAQSSNRVSDYLGHMWRKGLVARLPSPRMDRSAARWMYAWKGRAAPHKPDLVRDAIVYDGPSRTKQHNITIEETEDEVKIVLEGFTIVVKPNK